MKTCSAPKKDFPPASDADTPPNVPVAALNSWGWSLQGSRKGKNQDAFLNWPERRCWAVADGVGSSEHGEMASRALMEALMRIPEPDSLDAHVRHARAEVERVNEQLVASALVSGTAASTIVALLMHEGNAACLWAGDSRCYLLRDGVLYQCTRDHTLRQEKIDTGELTVPEAHRMVRGNIITNAIGGKLPAKIDEIRFNLRIGDRLLLCSDGLSNLLEATTLTKLLAHNTALQSADHIRDVIADFEQPDNITLVTIFLSTG